MILTGTLLVLLSTTTQQLPTDRAASAATVSDVRNVGTAMMTWLVDQIAELPPQSSSAATLVSVDQPDPIDWANCQLISHADLTSLLVPMYILEIPEEDGWGNDFEFCVERQDLEHSRYIIGVRSPGRDAVFERADYLPGAFDRDDWDSDIVWLDGFFARWPKSPTEL